MVTRRTCLVLAAFQGALAVVTRAGDLGPSAGIGDWLAAIGGATVLVTAFVALARPGRVTGDDPQWWLAAALGFSIVATLVTGLF